MNDHLKWICKRIITGPKNERSLLRVVVSFWLYWRVWAAMWIIFAGWVVVLAFIGSDVDGFTGFAIGMVTTAVASNVLDDT